MYDRCKAFLSNEIKLAFNNHCRHFCPSWRNLLNYTQGERYAKLNVQFRGLKITSCIPK